MITKQQAIERAWDLVRRDRLAVRGVRSVALDAAPSFEPEWQSRGDIWKVIFDLDIPPNCVQSPDILVIIVDRETGEAAGIELL